ncbi:hypothetical protein M0R45_008709 [Rubus argutus]|uniref:Uncharacterized protein n=1 Tax=Rubus argutus TaxID=59490 RepID=A0AAW1Y204_RUBAR
MASISTPTTTPHKLAFPNPKSYPSSAKTTLYPSPSSRFSDSSLCRCRNPSSSSSDSSKKPRKEKPNARSLRALARRTILTGIGSAGATISSRSNNKSALSLFSSHSWIVLVISRLNRAIQEERYQDAALFVIMLVLDWWVEHGRYVARSYSPRQLATAAAGVPLFEIFLTVNKKGEYRQQAVYLKRGGVFPDSPLVSSKAMDANTTLNPLDSTEEQGNLFVAGGDDTEDGDDMDDGLDLSEGLSGFQSILRDMIPNMKVKVLKVTSPGKVDQDLISKVIEQIIEEDDDDDDDDDEDKDNEIENSAAEEEDDEDEEKVDGNQETDVFELDADPAIIQNGERQEIAVKVVFGGLGQKISNIPPTKNLVRVPAKIEKKGRLSFSFTIEKDINQLDSRDKERASVDKKAKIGGQRSIDNVMFDLAKFIGKEKIPLKVLKDVGGVDKSRSQPGS